MLFCYTKRSLIGEFDGCRGLGARQYENYETHTGAYVASRLVSGAAYDWFQKRKDSGEFDYPVEEIKDRFEKAPHMGEQAGGNALKIRGSMVRNFPPTAAIALADQRRDICCKCHMGRRFPRIFAESGRHEPTFQR